MKKITKNKLKLLLLSSFIFLLNQNINAQTFDNDGDWNVTTNWNPEALPGVDDIVTITANPVLNIAVTIDKIVASGSAARTITGTNLLTLDGITNPIIHANANAIFTIDTPVRLNSASTRRIDIKNNASAQLIFDTNSTLTLDNAVQIRNFSVNPTLFKGALNGSGNITVSSSGSLVEAIIFESTANNSAWTGNMISFARDVTSNIVGPNLFMSQGQRMIFNSTAGSLTLNGENSFEGEIDRSAGGTSTFTVNANQNNIDDLDISGGALTLNIGASVTNLVFNAVNLTGTLDIVGFKEGVIKVPSGTDVSSVTLGGVAQGAGTTLTVLDSGYIVYTPATITTMADGNWEDGSTWTGGNVPDPFDHVQIGHNVDVNSDVEVSNFELTLSTTITNINSNASITVNGNAITNNDVINKSTSTESSSFLVKGTYGGQVFYEKFINSQPGNDLISSVATTTFGSFYTAGTNENLLYDNPADLLNEYLFGPFNNATGAYVNWKVDTNSGESLIAGKGYRAATESGQVVRFKANPHHTDVAIAITEEAGTAGAWNLIGNPHPTYLDFTSFFNANKDALDAAAQAIYGYKGTSASWEIYNLANVPANNIAPGQGFFVKSKSGGATVNFDLSMRTVTGGDDFIASKTSSKSSNRALAKLVLDIDQKSYNTSIYFIEGRTKGMDTGYDAQAYLGHSDGLFTELLKNGNGKEFAIQTLDYQDFNDVKVPLGVRAQAGKTIRIKLDTNSLSVPSNINIYLEDKENNSFTLLNSSDYTFNNNIDLDGLGRFYIHFSSKTLSIESSALNALQVYSSSKKLYINGQLNGASDVSIFDIQGRLVLNKKLDVNKNSNILNVSSLTSGLYLVKVNNANQKETKKLIIE